MNARADNLFSRFFSLRSVGEFKELVEDASSSPDPRELALARYAMTWAAYEDHDRNAPFDPLKHISRDLSSGLFGRIPSVFLGSNDWAARAIIPESAADREIGAFEELAAATADACPDAKIVAMIAPEKDYLANYLYYDENRCAGLAGSIRKLGERLEKRGIALVFEQAFRGMSKHLEPGELEYYDTHLPAKIYLQLFAQSMKSAGFDWSDFSESARIRPAWEYLDLSEKLEGAPGNPVKTTIATISAPEAAVVGGCNTFAKPLRDTRQQVKNPHPLVDSRALVLGDSHCSIFQRDKLTGLFGRTFRDVDFFWNPWAVHGFLPTKEYEFVFLEISQRFMLRGSR